jgi:hypothetical protein
LEHSRVSVKHDRHQQVTHHEAINLIICRDAREGIAMTAAHAEPVKEVVQAAR